MQQHCACNQAQYNGIAQPGQIEWQQDLYTVTVMTVPHANGNQLDLILVSCRVAMLS